jgi:outer membrane protein assembly factor BamB
LGLSGCQKSKSNKSLAMFRGDLQHTGTYLTKGPDILHGVKWKFPTNGPIRSSPVISKQVIYFGSDDSHLYAVDLKTGLEKWSFTTKGAIKSSPAIVNGDAYFLSSDGNLYALDAHKGTLKWSFKTQGIYKPRDPYDYWESSPAVQDGIVYIGDAENTFYAVDASKGTLLWKQSLKFNDSNCDDECLPLLRSSPAIGNGMVYIGLSGNVNLEKMIEPGNVIGLDAKSGKQIWISTIMSSVDTSPVLDDHALYVGGRNNGIHALDLHTGKELWHSYPPYVLSSAALNNGTLYSGSSDSLILAAIDSTNGNNKWSFLAEGPIHASPVTDGQIVFCASGNNYTDDNLGFIYAVDAQTGKELWRYHTGGNIYSSPIIDNGVLYVGSDDGNLYAVN